MVVEVVFNRLSCLLHADADFSSAWFDHLAVAFGEGEGENWETPGPGSYSDAECPCSFESLSGRGSLVNQYRQTLPWPGAHPVAGVRGWLCALGKSSN